VVRLKSLIGRSRDTRQEFERLAREHQNTIFSAALRLTGSYADAEDLTQDALVRAYMAFDQFESGTNFRAWMLKIVTNTHINRYRKAARSPSTIAWEELTDGGQRHIAQEASDDVSPDDEVLEFIPGDEIGPALAELPDEFRQAVILSDLHDLSYKDIAQVLNIPLGTVRSRIFRGRRLLRQKLEAYAHAYHLL